MKSIDRVVVQRMEALVQCHSAEQIQDLFGISLNTWNKLRQGAPIRTSVAERLLQRLERQHPGLMPRSSLSRTLPSDRTTATSQTSVAA